MDNIKEAFGANIRMIRKDKKLTLESLATRAEITPRLLSKIEGGDTFISVETLCKISLALNTDLPALFDFDWYDDLIYYDENKYIKHHFKLIRKGESVKVKEISPLFKNTITNISRGDIASFLIEKAQQHKMTIYADYFIGKERKQIYKATPEGKVFCMLDENKSKKELEEHKDKNYNVTLEKFRKIAPDRKKIEYIKIAMDALDNQNARGKLRAMLDALDIANG